MQAIDLKPFGGIHVLYKNRFVKRNFFIHGIYYLLYKNQYETQHVYLVFSVFDAEGECLKHFSS